MSQITTNFTAELFRTDSSRLINMGKVAASAKRAVGESIFKVLAQFLAMYAVVPLQTAVRLIDELMSTDQPAAVLRRGSLGVALSHNGGGNNVTEWLIDLRGCIISILSGTSHLAELEEAAAIITPDPVKILHLLGWDPDVSLEQPVDANRYEDIMLARGYQERRPVWQAEERQKLQAEWQGMVKLMISCLPGLPWDTDGVTVEQKAAA